MTNENDHQNDSVSTDNDCWFQKKCLCWNLIHVSSFGHNFWLENQINAMFAALETGLQDLSNGILFAQFR